VKLLRQERDDPGPTGEARAPHTDAADPHPRRALVCVACRNRITSEAARIEVAGEHRHVCVNPSGVPFDIACFDLAPGCVPHGRREGYWSWFAGYDWQIALCGTCRAHLGWSFHGDGTFYGLIASRLAPEEGPEP
jgi:hypothetical protein